MNSRRTRSPGRLPRLILVFTLLVVSYCAELTARALLPVLLRYRPLLLVSLDSNTHDVLLAGLKLPLAELVVVAVAWRFTVHFIHYVVGLWYGDVVLRWLRKKWRPSAVILEKVEVIFDKYGAFAVFIFNDNLVCLLAGAAKMRIAKFVAFHLAGTLLHIFMLVLIMRHTQGVLGKAVAFIDGDVAPLTVLCIIVTLAAVAVMAATHHVRIRELIADLLSKEGEPNSHEHDDSNG